MAGQHPKINITVLIAPLDWGLGHATRCIPIIRTLLQDNCRVIIAASGSHRLLLQQEFPKVECIDLDGYGIRYGKGNILWKMITQLPRFYQSIKKENKWLAHIIERYEIDAVISDNRYGLYTKKIPCVFITHQLQIKTPRFISWMESYIRKNLYFFINQFTACWVPDIADCEQSLAGSLSHPVIMPSVPTKYIGWLSRFEKMPIVEKKYLLTISISGPEPQRTLLEEMLLLQLEYIEGQILLIRGLPGNAVTPRAGKHIQIVNHLSAADMQAAFMQSSFVVSRSGYSTVMDMQVLGCKCIYIPTPGQTEQEYIGSILLMRKMGLVKKQQGFNLAAALDEAQFFPFYTHSDTANNQLAGSVIVQWLKEIV